MGPTVVDKNRKKSLLREYKDRKQQQGIYAVRCEAAGKIWVAASKNLDRQQNSLWFQLKNNGFPNKDLQSLWNTHGESAFKYEILETIDDDNPLLIDGLLKEHTDLWRTELKADALI